MMPNLLVPQTHPPLFLSLLPRPDFASGSLLCRHSTHSSVPHATTNNLAHRHVLCLCLDLSSALTLHWLQALGDLLGLCSARVVLELKKVARIRLGLHPQVDRERSRARPKPGPFTATVEEPRGDYDAGTITPRGTRAGRASEMDSCSLLVQAAAETATAAPLPPAILAANINHDHTTRGTGRLLKRTSMWSGSGSWREPPSNQALPLLLRRPRPPPTTTSDERLLLHPLPPSKPVQGQDSQENKKEDTGGKSTRSLVSRPSDVLRLMDSLRVPVETDVYLSLVKECTDNSDDVQGAGVHGHIQQSSPFLLRCSRPDGLLLSNRLLLMYGACRKPEIALQLFDRMPTRDSISWLAMIAALTDSGSHREALQLFVEMLDNKDTDSSNAFLPAAAGVLRSCIPLGYLQFGQQIHGLVLKIGGNCAHQLGNPLIQLYGMLGCRESARKLLHRLLPCLDAAAWTSMITTCCRRGQFKEALLTFGEMGRAGSRKNYYAFSSALVACAGLGDGGWSGRQVHASTIKAGVASNQFVGSSLVNMYGKYGLLTDARRVFELIDDGGKGIACWDVMLRSFTANGCCAEAMRFVLEMKAAGINPQQSTLIEVQSVCKS